MECFFKVNMDATDNTSKCYLSLSPDGCVQFEMVFRFLSLTSGCFIRTAC